jgi:predicted ArsR family transcriptional regulator
MSKLRVLQAVQKTHPTTVRDIAAQVGVAGSTVMAHLEKLKAEGLVVWEPGKARTIRPA